MTSESSNTSAKTQQQIELSSRSGHPGESPATSGQSNMSYIIARTRAKAEAAKTKLKFVAKEAEMRKLKAGIEADLLVLEVEKQTAAAEAELQVLEMSSTSGYRYELASQVQHETEVKQQRTKDYVDEQSRYQTSHLQNQTFDNVLNSDISSHISPIRNHHRPPNVNKPDINLQQNETNDNRQPLPELTRFLLKKDLLLASLTQYNDKPECFPSWKTSFQSVARELNFTYVEEMDMLTKWLGPDSSKQALSMKMSNATQPEIGLRRVWERLEERYGSPEQIETSLKLKLNRIPKLTVKDNKRLYELADIVSEIECIKEDVKYHSLLSYYDSSSGVSPIVSKLPFSIQQQWTARASEYKNKHNVTFPPFTFFVQFIHRVSRVQNDPSFVYEAFGPSTSTDKPLPVYSRNQKYVTTKKTQLASSTHGETTLDKDKQCPLHKTNHSLNKCCVFRTKPYVERKQFLRENEICYKCCETSKHKYRDCQTSVACSECGSLRHPSALHVEYRTSEQHAALSPTRNGGERSSEPAVTPKCTQICGNSASYCGKSCAKLVLVNVTTKDNPRNAIKTYAIIDDQSNRSLAQPELLDMLEINNEQIEYSLASCSGTVTTSGRRASGCIIESLDGTVKYDLPTLIECSQIPNIRDEIPTPAVASHHPHLYDIANHIPALDNSSEILLLIGRDLIDAHHVLEQRTGPPNSPYAHKLSLGWVIVGESCLGKLHRPEVVNVNKTHLLSDGRESIFSPCPNQLKVSNCFPVADGKLGAGVFEKTKDDERPGMSIEDREFVQMMDSNCHMDPDGHWVMPLPFRSPRPKLPNNRSHSWKRAMSLDKTLKKDRVKEKHFVSFMQNLFDHNHAEVALPLKEDEECWYLPIFGVYHPKKPDRIRGVFDSSALYDGICLNGVLLSGPDLTNNLLGILLRFRRESVAMTADIEQMFYCFKVRKEDRNFLRFFWYRDNNPYNAIIEYRMCVHVFGNSPSAAVATYGRRKAVQQGGVISDTDVVQFVQNDFYVDDGLTALPTIDEAVDLMKRTQEALEHGGKLRLHKIASNSSVVMEAFPQDDLAGNLKDLDFSKDDLPLQRSLGLCWDLGTDTFSFDVSSEDIPSTRREALSVVNSLYDPVGFVAPVTIIGKLLIRDLIMENADWDEPLSEQMRSDWDAWRVSVRFLETLRIPRTYLPGSLSTAVNVELHVFADASEVAIAAAAYILTRSRDGDSHLGFVLGKAKVAPKSGHTIPRLELCAAVLAVDVKDTVSEELGVKFDQVKLYTDSKVVLGYIHNQQKRFFVYVGNRVDRIRRSSSPEQWSYVRSELNPSDCATRPSNDPHVLTRWLEGPLHLLDEMREESQVEHFPLVEPGSDRELRPSPNVNVLQTHVSSPNNIGSDRFERFSSWDRLVCAFGRLKRACRLAKARTDKSDVPSNPHVNVPLHVDTEHYIIRMVQQDTFIDELTQLKLNKSVPKGSLLVSLNPFIDGEGLLRVGGRLDRSELTFDEKHPLIIPRQHHIAKLLVRHFHEGVEHQGRHFTEGAVRAGGYWILGGRRLINSVVHHCVKCRRLRGHVEVQKMSNLPADRVTPSPPFSYVGVDTFGPWSVVSRRTRGGVANSKRWAVLFTCLTARAVHIEVIDGLSSSAFINALRRFISIRGKVAEFRSDCGTNFIGSTDSLNIHAINVESDPITKFLNSKKAIWRFNAPHSSHMGGVWERMIRITRRILDSVMCGTFAKNLTHDVLTTFLAEVSAVINARPLTPVSTDPEAPEILSPSMLLTQKYGNMVLPAYDTIDMKSQWKHVQVLADIFWKRWRVQFLQTLQPRRKWQVEQRALKPGDLVLLKDRDVCRNDWPTGIITTVIPSTDERIRKCEVRIIKHDKRITYTRPITDLILLLSD